MKKRYKDTALISFQIRLQVFFPRNIYLKDVIQNLRSKKQVYYPFESQILFILLSQQIPEKLFEFKRLNYQIWLLLHLFIGSVQVPLHV